LIPRVSRKLFISDIHLSARQGDTQDLFLRFLRERAAGADELYILGDLFDAWIGDGDSTPPIPQIRDALRQMGDRGCKLFIQHGNRDFLLGRLFARQTGARLIDEEHCIDLNGRKALLMHGDLLCTDDIDYQKARRLLRNPVFVFAVSLLPIEFRARIAAYFRKGSAKAVAQKPKEIMDANPDTVVQYLRKHQAGILIHGHTHRPEAQEILLDAHQVRRFVLGDWRGDHATFLVADNEGLRLERFT